MNQESNSTNETEVTRMSPWTAVLVVALLALGVFGFVYQNAQTGGLRRQVMGLADRHQADHRRVGKLAGRP